LTAEKSLGIIRANMQIGKRLRDLRVAKNLSQRDVEERTGLMQSYISRVEHGHAVPSLETIEKCARALEIPTYQLFVGNDEKPNPILRTIRATAKPDLFGNTPKEERYLIEICSLLGKMTAPNRALILSTASKMARRKK
jgi:transcriptional regulator with XRE-family HTH domain